MNSDDYQEFKRQRRTGNYLLLLIGTILIMIIYLMAKYYNLES
jgi:hypothetical protein